MTRLHGQIVPKWVKSTKITRCTLPENPYIGSGNSACSPCQPGPPLSLSHASYSQNSGLKKSCGEGGVFSFPVNASLPARPVKLRGNAPEFLPHFSANLALQIFPFSGTAGAFIQPCGKNSPFRILGTHRAQS